jgi:hypothetical protein
MNQIKEDPIFGMMTSNEDILKGVLKNELTLFRHFEVNLDDCKLLLTWLNNDKSKFPYLIFFCMPNPWHS